MSLSMGPDGFKKKKKTYNEKAMVVYSRVLEAYIQLAMHRMWWCAPAVNCIAGQTQNVFDSAFQINHRTGFHRKYFRFNCVFWFAIRQKIQCPFPFITALFRVSDVRWLTVCKRHQQR